MISFSDGIKHLYLPKLNEVGQSKYRGLNEWLSKGAEYYILEDISNGKFSIQTYDSLNFLMPYSDDITRLSCASLESLRDIERKTWQFKFIGWNLTKFYYSAFFSAHCILKITGNSLSNIDFKAINKIRSIATSYGYSCGNLNAGLYCISVNSNENKYVFFKDQIYDNSHEGLWKYFLFFLNSSQNSIYGKLPGSDAQCVVDKMNELAAALKNNNSPNGNWLSRVRNMVNYSQSFGAWFPYKEYESEYDKIYSFIDLNLEEPLSIDLASFAGRDILYFVRTCQLINAIAHVLLSDLESKHPENRSFVKFGVRKFANLHNRKL